MPQHALVQLSRLLASLLGLLWQDLYLEPSHLILPSPHNLLELLYQCTLATFFPLVNDHHFLPSGLNFFVRPIFSE